VRVGVPAAGSKSYLVFYGTGFRNATPVNVKCMISGSEFPVEYAGPGGDAGLDLIRIPLHEANGDDFWSSVYVNPVAEVVLSIDGVLANRVLLAFSAPEPPCWLCK